MIDERLERWILAAVAQSTGRTVHEGRIMPPGYADQLFRFVDTHAYLQVELTDSATGRRRVFRQAKGPAAPVDWFEPDNA